MPVKVACKCGKKFTAKDDLIGKVVKCPNCSKPLPIRPPAAPSPPKGSADSLESVRAPVPQSPVQAPAPKPMAGLDDLFDEAGLEQTPTGTVRCPSCYASMAANSIICVECGYNVQTAEIVRTGDDDDDRPKKRRSHGNPLLDKAEVDLEFDAKESKRSTDPVSWYWYVLGMVCVAGFGTSFGVLSMVLTAEKDKPVTAPFSPWDPAFITCAIVGGTLFIIGIIPTIYRAFRKSKGHGIGSLTLVYGLIYAFMDKKCRPSRANLIFGTIFLGAAITILVMIGFPDPETWKSGS